VLHFPNALRIIYVLLINASLQMVTVNGSAQELLVAEL
jgi:hypothetical protein